MSELTVASHANDPDMRPAFRAAISGELKVSHVRSLAELALAAYRYGRPDLQVPSMRLYVPAWADHITAAVDVVDGFLSGVHLGDRHNRGVAVIDVPGADYLQIYTARTKATYATIATIGDGMLCATDPGEIAVTTKQVSAVVTGFFERSTRDPRG